MSLIETTPHRPRKFWTAREEKLLRQNYPIGGLALAAAVLPEREEGSIYQRAASLGLRSPRAGQFRNERFQTNEHIDGLIRRTYQGTPYKGMVADCARTVNRPRWWVGKRAMILGLKAPRTKEPPWCEAEVAIAEKMASRRPENIRKALKRAGFARTETGIVVKIKRLGISRVDPDRFSATGLAVAMGVDGKTVTRWIINGLLKCEKRGTARVAMQGGDEWSIHYKDVRRFVIENAAVVDIRKVDKFWFIELLARA